jgi:hypothetical protein
MDGARRSNLSCRYANRHHRENRELKKGKMGTFEEQKTPIARYADILSRGALDQKSMNFFHEFQL